MHTGRYPLPHSLVVSSLTLSLPCIYVSEGVLPKNMKVLPVLANFSIDIRGAIKKLVAIAQKDDMRDIYPHSFVYPKVQLKIYFSIPLLKNSRPTPINYSRATFWTLSTVWYRRFERVSYIGSNTWKS